MLIIYTEIPYHGIHVSSKSLEYTVVQIVSSDIAEFL